MTVITVVFTPCESKSNATDLKVVTVTLYPGKESDTDTAIATAQSQRSISISSISSSSSRGSKRKRGNRDKNSMDTIDIDDSDEDTPNNTDSSCASTQQHFYIGQHECLLKTTTTGNGSSSTVFLSCTPDSDSDYPPNCSYSSSSSSSSSKRRRTSSNDPSNNAPHIDRRGSTLTLHTKDPVPLKSGDLLYIQHVCYMIHIIQVGSRTCGSSRGRRMNIDTTNASDDDDDDENDQDYNEHEDDDESNDGKAASNSSSSEIESSSMPTNFINKFFPEDEEEDGLVQNESNNSLPTIGTTNHNQANQAQLSTAAATATATGAASAKPSIDPELKATLQNAKEQLQHEMKCTICMEIMVDSQSLHPCGHVICGSCAKKCDLKSTRKRSSCPNCRTVITHVNPCKFLDSIIWNSAVSGVFSLDRDTNATTGQEQNEEERELEMQEAEDDLKLYLRRSGRRSSMTALERRCILGPEKDKEDASSSMKQRRILVRRANNTMKRMPPSEMIDLVTPTAVERRGDNADDPICLE